MSSSPLFAPFRHEALSLHNRIVMAPMTRSRSPDGIPTADVAAYYRRRAEGGVGLIITEGTTVHRPGASKDQNIPNFHTEASLAGWRRVVQEVHAAGGKIAPQLWHMGMVRKPGTGPYPDGRSDGPSGKQVAEPMTDADIADTIAAFAEAAAQARETGFDAVELHGAHGYLLDQFFWKQSNRRTDDYGGDLARSTRFTSQGWCACAGIQSVLPQNAGWSRSSPPLANGCGRRKRRRSSPLSLKSGRRISVNVHDAGMMIHGGVAEPPWSEMCSHDAFPSARTGFAAGPRDQTGI